MQFNFPTTILSAIKVMQARNHAHLKKYSGGCIGSIALQEKCWTKFCHPGLKTTASYMNSCGEVMNFSNLVIVLEINASENSRVDDTIIRAIKLKMLILF